MDEVGGNFIGTSLVGEVALSHGRASTNAEDWHEACEQAIAL